MLYLLRLVAFTEGVSYLVILFITMPLKYIWDIPKPTFYVGTIHGALFIAYILLVIAVQKKKKWNLLQLALILIASLIPFATFWADKKYFRK